MVIGGESYVAGRRCVFCETDMAMNGTERGYSCASLMYATVLLEEIGDNPLWTRSIKYYPSLSSGTLD